MISEETQIRIIHTFYLTSIVLSSFLFGAYPTIFCYVHGLKTFVYLFLRFFSFKQKKFHYYMCDFCYFVNFFSIYVSFFNSSLILQKILFAVANGPLAISVIIFRNKIILHSFDHNTSTFIHISAMLLSFVLRWNGENNNINDSSWLMISLCGLCFYLVWMVFYSYIMFFCLRERIINKGNMTLFDWALDNTLLSHLKYFSDEKVRQVIYMCIHFIFCGLCIIISPIFWYNKMLHLVYIVFIIGNAFWNGSYYYSKLK